MKLNNFILEGVSHVITDALMSPALNTNALFYHVIQETITRFLPSSLWDAKYISRSQNFCALYMVYRAAARVIPGYIPFLNSPPSSIPICSGKDPPLFPLRSGFLVCWPAPCWSAGYLSVCSYVLLTS
jgi:hypothetical protein